MMPINNLLKLRAQWKLSNKKVVFTNGCFDLLHQGHLDLLAEAKSLGDLLIVGLNSDASVNRLKGASRPIENEKTRSMHLKGTQYVDYVILFHEDTPLKLIQALKPDILVKGGDYLVENIVGASDVTDEGGQVKIIPLTPGFSTTDQVEKMKREGLD